MAASPAAAADAVSPLFCPVHHAEALELGVPPECTVTIPSTALRTDHPTGQQYTVFQVCVKTCCSTWSVYRRYSEFLALYETLEKAHPTVKLPRLPPKKLLVRGARREAPTSFFCSVAIALAGGRAWAQRLRNALPQGSSLDPALITERQEALERMMVTLVNEPMLFDSQVMAQFLVGKRKDASTALNEQLFELRQQIVSVGGRQQRLEMQLKRVEFLAKTVMKTQSAPGSQLQETITQLTRELRGLKERVFKLELGDGRRAAGGAASDSGEERELERDWLGAAGPGTGPGMQRTRSDFMTGGGRLLHDDVDDMADRRVDGLRSAVQWGRSRRSYSSHVFSQRKFEAPPAPADRGRRDLLKGYFDNVRRARLARAGQSDMPVGWDDLAGVPELDGLAEMATATANAAALRDRSFSDTQSAQLERTIIALRSRARPSTSQAVSPDAPPSVGSSPVQLVASPAAGQPPPMRALPDVAPAAVSMAAPGVASPESPAQRTPTSAVPEIPPPALSPQSAEQSAEAVRAFLSSPGVVQVQDELVTFLQPSVQSEQRRCTVFQTLAAVIRKAVGAQVCVRRRASPRPRRNCTGFGLTGRRRAALAGVPARLVRAQDLPARLRP
jgi:hypothetical protein